MDKSRLWGKVTKDFMEIWDGIWDKLGEEDKNFKDTKEGVNMNHSREGRVLARPYRDTRKWQEGRKSLLLIQLGYRMQLKRMIREFRVWPGSKADSEVKISIASGREEPLNLLLQS